LHGACGAISLNQTQRRAVLQKKIFWLVFIGLDMMTGFAVSFVWSLILTLPIIVLSWWIAYKSGWFE